MSKDYINIYNNFIKLTTNKDLYKNIIKQDTFSDRMVLFLLHFAFFLKVFKNEKNTIILQEIYDFIFRQIELSIREIGYGDQSINKKMKDYINLFHTIVSDLHFWDTYDDLEKKKKISNYLGNFTKIDHLIGYFDEFDKDLSKKSLNSYLKSVINQ